MRADARASRRRLRLAGLAAAILLGAGSAGAQPPAPTATGRLVDASVDIPLTVPAGSLASNPVVVLTNEGGTAVQGVTISTPARDWATAARIVARVVPPGASEEATARALWQFVRRETFSWDMPSLWTSEGTDPVKLLGVYGYGLCTQRALALSALWRAAGLQVRFWQGLGDSEHDVPEVWFDGRWHLLDADRDALFLLPDNRTIAGIDDLRADPSLVLRAGPGFEWLHDILLRTRTDLRVLPVDPYLEQPYALRFPLWPGERLELHATPQAPPFSDEAASQVPPAYGTSIDTVPLVTAGRAVDAAITTNLAGNGHLSVVDTLNPGELSVAIGRAFPLVGLAADVTASLGPGERLRLLGQRHADGFTLAATDFRADAFRLPGVWVSDANVAAGMLPLQVTDPSRPGTLVYALRRRGSAPVRLLLVVYEVEQAEVAVEVSGDAGASWTRIWTPAPDERDYVQTSLDLTPYLAEDRLQVRFVLDAGGRKDMGWTAALQRVEFTGVEGPTPTELGTVDGPFDGTAHLSFTGALLPAGASATYGVRLAAVLESPDGTGRLTDLTARLEGQVRPERLLALDEGSTTLRVQRASSDGDADVRVEVRWSEQADKPAPTAPAGPVSPARDAVMEIPSSVAFSWSPAAIPAPGGILRYHLQVCPDPQCLSPVTAEFETYTTPAASGDAPAAASLAIGILLERDRTYYWRVRAQARGSERWGPFSEVWRFTTGLLPTVRIAAPAEMTATSPFVTMSGAVVHAGNLSAMRWRTSDGQQGDIAPDGSWRAPGIPVKAGATVVTITATTSDGREVSQEVRVRLDQFKYYLAEGTVDPGFTTRLIVANPNPVDAPVSLRLLTGNGEGATLSRTLKAWSRQVFDERDLLGEDASGGVSAEIVSQAAVPLVAERVMTWAGGAGVHATQSTDAPQERWYFAEGAQGFFETFFLIVNPSSEWLPVTATFLLDGGGTVTRRFDVAPSSRFNIWTRIIPELEGRAFATILEGNRPFSTERSMYMNRAGTWLDGHGAAGTPWPSRRWYFAEGATGAYFDTFLLLANPEFSPATVRVTWLLPDGRTEVGTYTVPARSRLTLHVDGEAESLHDTAVGFEVTSDLPVVAERAMYWPGSALTWSGTHASGGQASPGLRWGVATGAGSLTGAAEHFVLVANPDPAREAVVRVRYFGSGQVVQQEYTVPPGSRFTLWLPTMVPELGSMPYGTELTSTNGVPVLVESALYWNTAETRWRAGANLPATRLPDVP
ncbi:hypothetical protein TBR22_A08580 [Luteitalea sp. TBR-22]|nr:hypothetical protein TBR22_A08580 [Luteitalea sp. TBR-22]